MKLDGWCVAAALSFVLTGQAAAYDPAPPLSPWGPNDEAGNTNLLSPAKALQAKDFIKTGVSFVLAHDSENGMPLLPSNVWLQTLKGSLPLNQQVSNLDFFVGDFTHDGTQFDALCHFGYLPTIIPLLTQAVYYNRFKELDVVGLDGCKKLGVDKVKPYLTKAILVDVARHLFANRVMPEGREITVDMMLATLAKQDLTPDDIEPGDVVLFRTGWERNWHVTPGGLQATLDYYKGFPGIPGGVPGVGLPLAVWLTDKQVSGVGADNWGVDVQPARNPPPGIVLPVHHQLLTRGIPQFESLVLEALSDHLAAEHAASGGGARGEAYKFAFFFSPLRIKGGTGSPASPVAFK